jgi:hypothetical protein
MTRKRVDMCLTHIFTIFVLEMGRGSFETSILAKEIESLKPIVLLIVQLFQLKVGETVCVFAEKMYIN